MAGAAAAQVGRQAVAALAVGVGGAGDEVAPVPGRDAGAEHVVEREAGRRPRARLSGVAGRAAAQAVPGVEAGSGAWAARRAVSAALADGGAPAGEGAAAGRRIADLVGIAAPRGIALGDAELTGGQRAAREARRAAVVAGGRAAAADAQARGALGIGRASRAGGGVIRGDAPGARTQPEAGVAVGAAGFARRSAATTEAQPRGARAGVAACRGDVEPARGVAVATGEIESIAAATGAAVCVNVADRLAALLDAYRAPGAAVGTARRAAARRATQPRRALVGVAGGQERQRGLDAPIARHQVHASSARRAASVDALDQAPPSGAAPGSAVVVARAGRVVLPSTAPEADAPLTKARVAVGHHLAVLRTRARGEAEAPIGEGDAACAMAVGVAFTDVATSAAAAHPRGALVAGHARRAWSAGTRRPARRPGDVADAGRRGRAPTLAGRGAGRARAMPARALGVAVAGPAGDTIAARRADPSAARREADARRAAVVARRAASLAQGQGLVEQADPVIRAVAPDGARLRASAAATHAAATVGAASALGFIIPVTRRDADQLGVQGQAGRALGAASVWASAEAATSPTDPTRAVLSGLTASPRTTGAGCHAEPRRGSPNGAQQPLRAVTGARAGAGASRRASAANADQPGAAVRLVRARRAAHAVGAGPSLAVVLVAADVSRRRAWRARVVDRRRSIRPRIDGRSVWRVGHLRANGRVAAGQ